MTLRIRGRAFTLLEVMIGLALLGLALTVLIKSAANNIFNAQQARMMGVATDLARGKMYELEEHLTKDGFQDMEEHQEDQKFTDEGWPAVTYSYTIVPTELPSWDVLQQMAKGKYLMVAGCGSGGSAGSGSNCGSGSSAPGSGYSVLTQKQIDKLSPEDKAQLQAQYGSDYGFGSGSGSGSGSFQDSILGMMLSQYGGMGGSGDAAGANGNALVQAYYTQFQQILKVSIRKVSLTVKWKVGVEDREMTIVAYFTDPAAMDQVLSGAGATDITPDGGSGSGSSSTTGSGSNTGTGRITPKGSGG